MIRHAEVQQVKISPDGKHIAVQKLHEGERVLVFMSLSPLEVTGALRFRGKEEVGNFYWATDDRAVVEVIARTAALEQPVNYGSLYAINADGSQGKNIFGWRAGEMQTGSKIRKAKSTRAHATIIDPLVDNDNEILISTRPWARDFESHGSVYRVNIYSGVRHRVIGLPQVGGRAFTDGAGNLVFANGTDRATNYELFRKTDNGWSPVEEETLSQAYPVGFDRETNTAFLVLDRNGATEQLIKLDMKSGKTTPVFRHEEVDISRLISHPVSDRPLGVTVDPGYPETYFFDESEGFAAFYRGLLQAFEGHRIRFTSVTRDGGKAVLKVSGDRLPGDYFLVDLNSKKASFLLPSADWLKPDDLNPMRAESFTSSDDLDIGVYLTFPRNRQANIPMVVMPHGGPRSRDYWGYDRDAQILSQNGYLVLQVNFRGSTGYGDQFLEAGTRHWGNHIQRDIAEAVQWAVREGYADPERVCIFGASFGGYSALMNPIRYPDLYQCAVGYVGVYDLEMLYKRGDIRRRDRGVAYLEEVVSRDEAFLKENSPLHNVDQLDLPVFIVHGAKDERAPVEHAEAMIEQLQAAGKPFQSLILPNEGHGFYAEENNMQLYGQLLEFLDQHIGVGSSEKPDRLTVSGRSAGRQ
ncbi:hypothetical protein AVO43_00980 [Microbulbifer sp. ZGT114]|nr:hypothetical protein AVO43_00980 [Microbulbifer sp. ZGT114]